MSTELIVNASLPETRIALLENGEIQELLLERATGKGIVGNIYKGRVTRVLPGMQAAFVDIGLEKAAFLYVDDVFVHSEIWEAEEGASPEPQPVPVSTAAEVVEGVSEAPLSDEDADEEFGHVDHEHDHEEDEDDFEDSSENEFESDLDVEEDEDEHSDDDDHGPRSMGPSPGGEGGGDDHPPGTLPPHDSHDDSEADAEGDDPDEEDEEAEESELGTSENPSEEGAAASASSRRRRRRGRRGGKNRNRRDEKVSEVPGNENAVLPVSMGEDEEADHLEESIRSSGEDSEHSGPEHETSLEDESGHSEGAGAEATQRPVHSGSSVGVVMPTLSSSVVMPVQRKPEFRENRDKLKRIKPKTSTRPIRGQVKIEDLLQEGQEVLVQVAKDPISTKGARLTCHISLPGRHLVCMPTVDHVGVSRRIEREDERRRLRDFVERNRPRSLGFIVRTASGGKGQAERQIKQDMEYLTRLWDEIREKSASVTAPALVYEDLNSVLRAIRDWVSEEIDRILVDSRYHFNEIMRFASHFMPSLKEKVELYHGDQPIFDAYGISTELSRALERKVWLKSGGYIVVDQAEALVAIDVNTGRYVGKKNLEDTILKTNLEAVEEIAYQLRLRNCGGIIILDLIDMEKEENKQRVYRALEEALKKDRARPTILKISELGLVEMTRKRTRDTIVRSLCDSCNHCEGKGYIKSKQTVAYEILREVERQGIDQDVLKILIQAHSDVIDALAIEERETLDQLERRYRKQIYLQAVLDHHPEQYEVVGEMKDGSTTAKGKSAAAEFNREKNREREKERSRRRRGKDRNDTPTSAPSSSRERDTAATEAFRSPEDRGRSRGRGKDQAPSLPQPSALPVARSHPDRAVEKNVDPGIQAAHSEIEDDHGLAETQNHAPDSEFFDEEDRLAFLRAQAAQDAALSALSPDGGHTGPHSRPGAHAPAEGRGGAGGQNRSRKRRRGGRGRNQTRGPERAASGNLPKPIDESPASSNEGSDDSSHNPV